MKIESIMLSIISRYIDDCILYANSYGIIKRNLVEGEGYWYLPVTTKKHLYTIRSSKHNLFYELDCKSLSQSRYKKLISYHYELLLRYCTYLLLNENIKFPKKSTFLNN